MSRVSRSLLRAGVERSRRFVMLPSFGLSGLAVVAFVDLGCDASPLELSEEWIVQGGVWSSNRASVTGTSLVITMRRGFGWILPPFVHPSESKRVTRTRCPSTSACCDVAAAARLI